MKPWTLSFGTFEQNQFSSRDSRLQTAQLMDFRSVRRHAPRRTTASGSGLEHSWSLRDAVMTWLNYNMCILGYVCKHCQYIYICILYIHNTYTCIIIWDLQWWTRKGNLKLHMSTSFWILQVSHHLGVNHWPWRDDHRGVWLLVMVRLFWHHQIQGCFDIYIYNIYTPSRQLTHPTFGGGKASSKVP